VALPQIAPIIPMSAAPLHRPGWVYEETVDGWRIIAYNDGAHVRLIGRRGVDHRNRFPDLVGAIAALPATSLILDGEVAMSMSSLSRGFISSGSANRWQPPRLAHDQIVRLRVPFADVAVRDRVKQAGGT